MGSYRDHEREIKAFLWSAIALYVLCALLLTLAFVLHRYWIEKESGFEVRGQVLWAPVRAAQKITLSAA